MSGVNVELARLPAILGVAEPMTASPCLTIVPSLLGRLDVIITVVTADAPLVKS